MSYYVLGGSISILPPRTPGLLAAVQGFTFCPPVGSPITTATTRDDTRRPQRPYMVTCASIGRWAMEQAGIVCARCGRRCGDHDHFCAGCGTPLLPEDRERAAGWETCAIDLHKVSSPLIGAWHWRFVAASRSVGAPMIVARSPIFAARTRVTKRSLTRLAYEAPPPNEEAQAARAALVTQLATTGWEGTALWPGSSAWFAQLFRRRPYADRP